jgi:hypothetical protein
MLYGIQRKRLLFTNASSALTGDASVLAGNVVWPTARRQSYHRFHVADRLQRDNAARRLARAGLRAPHAALSVLVAIEQVRALPYRSCKQPVQG